MAAVLFYRAGACAVCFQYAVENEELTQHLVAAKDAQRQLTAEVILHPSAAPFTRSSPSGI